MGSLPLDLLPLSPYIQHILKHVLVNSNYRLAFCICEQLTAENH